VCPGGLARSPGGTHQQHSPVPLRPPADLQSAPTPPIAVQGEGYSARLPRHLNRARAAGGAKVVLPRGAD
jgi:hypothetical protein